jgi:hypothetical protein
MIVAVDTRRQARALYQKTEKNNVDRHNNAAISDAK